MCHVHATGIAPFGDDVSVPYDHSSRSTADLEGTDPEAERLAAAEVLVLNLFLVSRQRDLMSDGVVYGCLYSGGVHPHLCGPSGLPGSPIWDVLGGERGG